MSPARYVPVVVLFLSIALPCAAHADGSFEAAAKSLSAATVTVRMRSAGGDDANRDKNAAVKELDATDAPAKRVEGKLDPLDEIKSKDAKSSGEEAPQDSSRLDRSNPDRTEETIKRRERRDGFVVASGVCVGDNLFVTAMRPQGDSEFRITLPGGRRADANLCVFDANTSLVLLEGKPPAGEKLAAAPVKLAANRGNVGARLLAASALGAEPPTVSSGVLGAVDRFVPSSGLPPLLQCDVHTTETSRGAGVVNQSGELVGVIVAFEGSTRRLNWTYLVGSDHVARLMAARKEGQFVELPRRVAHAGVDLRQSATSDAIVVRQVTKGGPAEKAGLQPGDELYAMDGRPIHSVFAAARLVASRQPGEKLECVVRRGEQQLTCIVTLEETTGEPTFSFAGKTSEPPTEGAPNPAPRSVTESRRFAEPRGIAESRGKQNAEPSIAPDDRTSPDAAAGKVGEVDSFTELRERLREREALIKRLEAELAELRRERDRIAGTLNPEAAVPESAGPQAVAPPSAPQPLPVVPKK
jgi:S1-C subfamily serine protease